MKIGIRPVIKALTGLFLLGLFGCEKVLDLRQAKADPVSVFQETWRAMDQRYALFGIKSVDWKKTYDEFRPQVKNDLTEGALYTLINKLLETLEDGHVALITATDTSRYDGFYKLFPGNFNYTNILNNYLKNDFKSSGPAIYKTQTNVGYIYYSSFKNDISEEQVNVMLDDMSSTKGLIIDVRGNMGGKSTNAEKLFQRFISDKRLVKYEVAKKGSGHEDFFEPAPYYLSPRGNYYNKPVCVLTNRQCFSTCNDFVLYMSKLPNVILVGDDTGGGGGIPQNYILANGWKIQYTSTITLSPEKMNIENGIKPGIRVSITALDERLGKDPILEKAFELLQ